VVSFGLMTELGRRNASRSGFNMSCNSLKSAARVIRSGEKPDLPRELVTKSLISGLAFGHGHALEFTAMVSKPWSRSF